MCASMRKRFGAPSKRSERTADKTVYTKADDKWVAKTEQIQIPGPGLPLAYGSVRATIAPEPPKPPLADLAYENILHTQMRSDRNAQIQVSGIPVMVIKGFLQSELGQAGGEDGTGAKAVHLGRSNALRVGPESDVSILEIQGASLKASREELIDIEMRMGRVSIAIIDRFVKGAESAESRRIDERQATSSVRTIARTVQAVIGDAVKLSAAWSRGVAATADIPAVPVAVATSQAGEPPSTADIELLAELVEARRLPVDILWLALERAELLPQGASVNLKDLAELDPAGEEPPDDPGGDAAGE